MTDEKYDPTLGNDSEKAFVTGMGGAGYHSSMQRVREHMAAPREARIAAARVPSPQKKVSMQSAFQPVGGQVRRSIPCPHCGEEMSRAYAIKSLALLAKSEGMDIEDDLLSLVPEEEVNEFEAEKGLHGKGKGTPKGPTNYVGNNEASYKQPHKPGKFHHSARPGSGEAVMRHAKPTNPVSEGGMHKSILFPVVESVQLVEYTTGADEAIAKAVGDHSLHVPPARNFRYERELAEMQKSESSDEVA